MAEGLVAALSAGADKLGRPLADLRADLAKLTHGATVDTNAITVAVAVAPIPLVIPLTGYQP